MCMKNCKMCPVHKIATVLVLVGALNWGLVGVFDWNLVTALLGSMPTVVKVVYGLVGLSAVLMSFACKCKKCNVCYGGDHGCGGDKSCGTGGEGKSCCSEGEHKM